MTKFNCNFSHSFAEDLGGRVSDLEKWHAKYIHLNLHFLLEIIDLNIKLRNILKRNKYEVLII
jgi:hypothetical protein